MAEDESNINPKDINPVITDSVEKKRRESSAVVETVLNHMNIWKTLCAPYGEMDAESDRESFRLHGQVGVHIDSHETNNPRITVRPLFPGEVEPTYRLGFAFSRTPSGLSVADGSFNLRHYGESPEGLLHDPVTGMAIAQLDFDASQYENDGRKSNHLTIRDYSDDKLYSVEYIREGDDTSIRKFRSTSQIEGDHALALVTLFDQCMPQAPSQMIEDKTEMSS